VSSNTKQPLVSVIMNCYNGERYLREAIDSVYAQTYQNWEIIFWDNASTDGSADIAKSYDKKLRYFRSEETTVLGQARVCASKEVKGYYMAFLDVDDIWIEDKIEKQVTLFLDNTSKIGFIYGRSEVFYNDNSNDSFVIKKNEKLLSGDVFAELAKENFIVFSSVMVDTKKFNECGGFPKHFLNSTDFYVFLKMAQSYECRALQGVCCKYRIHDKNLSAKQRSIGSHEVIQTLKGLLPDDRVAKGIKYQYANLAVIYMREKKVLKSISIIIKHNIAMILIARLIKKTKRILS
jgi:glycosyltransferase involved in cell wall biosynthesis